MKKKQRLIKDDVLPDTKAVGKTACPQHIIITQSNCS